MKKRERPERDRDRNMIYQKWPGLSLAEKGKYIASYYGAAVGAAIASVIIIIFLISDVCKEKREDAFSVMVIDLELPEEAAGRMEQELSEALGVSREAGKCRIEAGYSGGANMQSEATVSAYLRSGRVDVLIAPEDEFNRYASTGYLRPLRECALEEWEEAYEKEDLFYAEAVDYSESGAVKDLPFRPHEVTKDSACYGIYLKDEVFGGYVAGVMRNCPNPERMKEGMEYFLEADSEKMKEGMEYFLEADSERMKAGMEYQAE